MKFSWQSLPKPFTVLAPMDDVTDTVFRQVVASCGKPDVFYTEFVNVEGLASVGIAKIMPKLVFSQAERPIIAQIWGIEPKNYFEAAGRLVGMGFDGIDINMGCPIKKVVKTGAGSAMIDNPGLAARVIKATKEGIASAGKKVPVSVKTRIGTKKVVTERWIGFLLEQGLECLAVHGRTAVEMSRVPARWDEIAKAVRLRDQMKLKTVIIGNGDIKSMEEAKMRVKQSGVDGVMIGRGIFQDLHIFCDVKKNLTKKDRLNLLLKHLDLYEKTYGQKGKFRVLKKYFKIYISGFDGAACLRSELMNADNIDQTREIVKAYHSVNVSYVNIYLNN